MRSRCMCGFGVVCAALGVVGCAPPPAAQECASGIVCPAGTQCAATQPVCIAGDCGNGIQDLGEECDDGNIIDGDGCSASCRFERCGNSVVDGEDGEVCDDGASNGQPGDPCSSTCQRVTCGNGVVEQGEECDDGRNNGLGNRCTPTCKFNVCGDGHPFTGVEQCDAGVNRIPKDTATCDTDCTAAVCGDGHLNTAAGEACDHGANNGKRGDACSLTCQTVTCGNGTHEQGEECDDGPNNGPNKRCTTSCEFNVCGDGHPFTGIEQCDDGVNGIARDSATCDADCTAVVCGDGHLNTVAGEICDHGARNGTAGDSCDSSCHLVGCGNGFVDPGEQCDPDTGMPATDSRTCDDDCTAVVCGDGHRNLVAEACDDGPRNGDPCPYNVPTCVRCNSTCTAMIQPGGPFCGDSLVTNGEICDQGLLRNGQECTYGDLPCLSGTAPVCNVDCRSFVTGPNGPFCGDNTVQPRFREQCDPGGGLTPADAATCDSDCTFAICGDGHANATAGEACDDGNTDACGTCTQACGAPVVPEAAAGSIVLSLLGAADVTDGDTFTLRDGVAGHPAIVFEFDSNGVVTAGHVGITFTAANTSAELAAAMRGAINAATVTLDITATVGTVAGKIALRLVNGHRSSLGNQPIGATGTIAARFVFNGLVNGAAGDCAAGVGCTAGADCSSGVCSARTGRCQ